MRRITVNALVDIGCLLTFIPALVSGLVLYLVLPSGGGRGSGSGSYLGIARDQWLNLHNYTSLAFATLIIVHPDPALDVFPEHQEMPDHKRQSSM